MPKPGRSSTTSPRRRHVPCKALTLGGYTTLERIVGVEGKKRILTGIRPTGPLHLGHYAGALENWESLQTRYDCSFLIADHQVSDYPDDVARMRQGAWVGALRSLGVGRDPGRGSFGPDTSSPEHADLTL